MMARKVIPTIVQNKKPQQDHDKATRNRMMARKNCKDKGDGHKSCININIKQKNHEKITMNKVMAKIDVTIVMQGEKIMKKP
jgi:hypothetical protein